MGGPGVYDPYARLLQRLCTSARAAELTHDISFNEADCHIWEGSHDVRYHNHMSPMQDKITVRIPADLASAFDTFIETSGDPIRTRQDGMRHILRDWLKEQGFLEETDNPNKTLSIDHNEHSVHERH